MIDAIKNIKANNLVRLVVGLLIIELSLIDTMFAKDTLYITEPIRLEKIGTEYSPGHLLINRKNFKVPYAHENGFFNGVSYPKDKFSQVYFRNSHFDVYESPGVTSLQEENSGFYVIDNCDIHLLPIFNTSGDIMIVSSRLKVLSVKGTDDLRLSLNGNRGISFIIMQNNRNLRFQLLESVFRDSAQIRIQNSTISQFDFGYNRRSGCNVFFQNDTINGFIATAVDANYGLKNYEHENIFSFHDCHINSDFIFFDRIPNSTFIFNNCTFGPSVYLADMAVDKIIIKNCLTIAEQFVFSFREKAKEVKLGLINSSLENIRFDFAPNIKLVFDSTDSKDAIANSYKSLLEKFEHEGKERSYKEVDLQYRRFKDSSIFHFVNSIWWHHGYEPRLVFIWTAGLLVLFFLFNSRYWRQMSEIYPLHEGEGGNIYNRAGNKARFYSAILLYTLFIFFSLRVDLNRLKFKNLKFVYAFLLQYVIGLWCLIFIIRFIVKL